MTEWTKIEISPKTRTMYNENNTLACWEWCCQRFGAPNRGNWCWDTYRTFEFEREEDAILFALRWE